MSTCRRAPPAAGPSAAIRPDPAGHDVLKPKACSHATAARVAARSGPNWAAYDAGDTVCPEAISLARREGSRTFSPKLRETVIASPAGPRWTAFRMAVARVGGGGAGRDTAEACACDGAGIGGPPGTE